MSELPKLVRDKIPALIQSSGKVCEFRQAGKEEMKLLIFNKFQEELLELFQDPSIEEAADVYEVFLQTLKYWNLDFDSVVLHAYYKREERGGFERGVVLEKIERNDKDV